MLFLIGTPAFLAVGQEAPLQLCGLKEIIKLSNYLFDPIDKDVLVGHFICWKFKKYAITCTIEQKVF